MSINLESRKPTTLEEAVEILESQLTSDDVNFIKENSSASIHFFFGMNLRNAWGLWVKETPIVQWFINNFSIGHADDISGMILSALFAKIKGEKFSAKSEAERYKQHWATMGVDPITGNKVAI